MSTIVRITRALTKAAMNIHAGRLVGLVRAAERAEQQAGATEEEAIRLSAWANENKRKAREALTDAIHRTDVVAEAVASELETLPFADAKYAASVRG